jgi:hypothetical protein
MSLAFVFPGQASQSIGMMNALAKASPIIEATFAEASAVLGYDLWQRCQVGPAELLNSTESTQPAMLTAGIATYRLWRARGGAVPVMMAGHSLGEFSALVAAGYLDFRSTVDLVKYRGELMQAAVPSGQGAIAAILGLEDADVEAACDAAAQGEVVEAVNFNAPGQVVIAGLAAAVARDHFTDECSCALFATAARCGKAANSSRRHAGSGALGCRGVRSRHPNSLRSGRNPGRLGQTVFDAGVLGGNRANHDCCGSNPNYRVRSGQGIDRTESPHRQESGSENAGPGGSGDARGRACGGKEPLRLHRDLRESRC